MIAKGDYPAELNIPIPFSLISNDVTKDRLVVMPAYWFMYNMYALERNGWKYKERDKRTERIQHLEYDYLAPDSINEIVESIKLFQKFTGKAYFKKNEPEKELLDDEAITKGKQLLEDKDTIIDDLEILADGFENSKRKVVLIKIVKSYHIFKDLVTFYCVNQLVQQIKEKGIADYEDLVNSLPQKYVLNEWVNVGGQLIPQSEISLLNNRIRDGKIKSWDSLHSFYIQQENLYSTQKLVHALAAVQEVTGVQIRKMEKEVFKNMLNSAVAAKEWMTKGICQSRAKDYTNPFRKITFRSQEEMDEVVGKLEDNSFINQQNKELINYQKQIEEVKELLKLN
ncbi:MAG: hypothetical protein WKG06_46440 [Segetibacter sp.]